VKRQITVEELLRDREETLGLENLTLEADLGRPITHPDPASPGLALAGFTERVVAGRVQVFGETEMAYLDSLEAGVVEERLRHLFHHDVPVVFVTKELEVNSQFLKTAKEYQIPVFRTTMGTGVFFQRLNPYLEAALAPTVSLHGSLADVYGVGLLFVGERPGLRHPPGP
jgi:HPr kinase/phosphorylase